MQCMSPVNTFVRWDIGCVFFLLQMSWIYFVLVVFTRPVLLFKISALSLPLPPKKLIGNMDREFIAERQKGLQNYLNVITSNHILSNCELVKKFLDPNSYSINYTGKEIIYWKIFQISTAELHIFPLFSAKESMTLAVALCISETNELKICQFYQLMEVPAL